ncbi:hypothetical protein CI109_102719 [Kwoniella shandongensis]|uniref:Uncharacterized protein n=1 Tax=Kwoniella shandongensis TaxID=1734106 RepID=A0A5M6BV60_9TREE|nr:uncharacterized protein CI109_004959 [Kwoniella shandongensis]KAA5526756.1 hypothetical protein CI109_004959 [Kwoniella shandongensis]
MFALTSFTTALLSFQAVAGLVAPRQAAPASASRRPFWPDGSAEDDNSSLESSIPFPCAERCQSVMASYLYCFIINTIPFSNGAHTTPDECNNYLCPRYDQLALCLNCVIANGEERAMGYHTNTSITAQPTSGAAGAVFANPNGLLDVEQANGWLKNVSDTCSGVGKPVSGESTVTATPTTTGPYYTSWTISQTVSLSVWTGLASVTDSAFVSISSAARTGSSISSVTVTPGGTSTSVAGGAAASTSKTSSGFTRVATSGLGWIGVTVFGLFVL